MASQNRSAGYCAHCQRGVTVVRPSGNGLFGRVRNALSNNDDIWVCSKCGNQASKSFTPPVDVPVAIAEQAPVTTADQHFATVQSTTIPGQDILPDVKAASANNKPEVFSAETGPEAICHLCNHTLPFKPSNRNNTITCPECKAMICLPGTNSESLLTSSPAVIKLEDDPERPAISKSLCTLCQFEMTYPKKLAGKDVDCPSCNTHFQLP